MAEISRVNRTTWRRNAKSKVLRSSLHAPHGAVVRVLPQPAVYQITVLSKTIVHRLILRVVPSAKFIKLFLRWLLEIYATVDDDHQASIRVLEKAGMKFSDYEFDEQGRFSVYSIKKP